LSLAPIVLFVYNRPEHTSKTLNALAKNYLASESELYIFSDGSKPSSNTDSILKVRQIISSKNIRQSFLNVTIHESIGNKGLKNSIIDGVSKVFKKHNKLIVLEDDLETSIDFLKFMNITLDKYHLNNSIGAITGYNPIKNMPKDYEQDIYFSNRSSSLGWATWGYIWKDVDWEAKRYFKYKKKYSQRLFFNAAGFDRAKRLDLQMTKEANSWSILFGFDLFIKKKLIIYPSNSKLKHLGWDGSGTHTSSYNTSKFNQELNNQNYPLKLPNKIVITSNLVKLQQDIFGNTKLSKMKDLIVFLKNYLK
jgi:hypothetical protein